MELAIPISCSDDLQPPPLPPFNNPIPEQSFLAKNYDENSKRPDRDPRGMFRNPNESTVGAGAGIVGPLGFSSFSMPNVERALTEMEASSAFPSAGPVSAGGINLVGPDSPSGAGPGRKSSGRGMTRPLGPSNVGNTTLSASVGPGARDPSAPTVGAGSRDRDGGRSPSSPSLRDPAGGVGGGGASPGSGGQTQHEVLQNFFQSLLSSKDRPSAGRTGPRLSNGPGGNGDRTKEGDDRGPGSVDGSNRNSMGGVGANGGGSGTEEGA